MTDLTSISKFFYELLNVSDLTDLLSGGIFRNQRPKNSENSDIIILTRFIKGTNVENINNGFLQLVLIIPKIAGQPNLILQETIEKKIIEILKNSMNKQMSSSFYFELENTTEYDNYEGQNLFSSLYFDLIIHKP